MTHEEIMQTLREGCEERIVCRLRIKGEPEDRIIHPYGVCFSTKDKLLIVAMQTGGYSKGRNPYGYRNFFFENCEEVELEDDTFEVDSSFNPFSEQYSGWLFHVLKPA